MGDEVDYAFRVIQQSEAEASVIKKQPFLVLFAVNGETDDSEDFFGTRAGCSVYVEDLGNDMLLGRWAYGYDAEHTWASDGEMERELLDRLEQPEFQQRLEKIKLENRQKR